MKAGFWVAPEGAEEAMSMLPIGGDVLEEAPGRRKLSLLATGKAEDLIRACPRVRKMLPEIVAALDTQAENAQGRLFDLTEFSADEILLIEDVVGEGEVAGVVTLPDGVGARRSRNRRWRACGGCASPTCRASFSPIISKSRACRKSRAAPRWPMASRWLYRRAPGGRDERHAAAQGNRRPRRRASGGRADAHHHLLAAADDRRTT